MIAAAPLMNGQVPLGEAVAFWILGPISLAGGIGMVTFRNAVHSALSLAATMMALGAMYVIQQGPFIGLVQVIVYTGAIVVLFLFVIMLLGIDRNEQVFADTFHGQRIFAAVVGLCVLAEVIFLGAHEWTTGASSVAGAVKSTSSSNVSIIGDALFTTYLLPFEITSALLVVAVIAAVVLARRHGDESHLGAGADQPDDAIAEREDQPR